MPDTLSKVSDKPGFVQPRDDQRLVIVGRTGSGKTQAGAWQLAMRNFDAMPWIILDYKRDHLLNDINAQNLKLGKLPSKPGLYIVHPMPTDNDAVEEYMWRIWAHENIGLFIDEGYMLGNSAAFRALLTQGRSKRIPMIILSQRPAWLTQFVFSEADYYQVFHLNNKEDRKKLENYMGENFKLAASMQDFHSQYYVVAKDRGMVLTPAPSAAKIKAAFRAALPHQGRKLKRM
jgi:hypothetical protein